MKTNVYVDGYNLYYGAVKNTPHKWLNIAAVCALLLPNDQINRIRYFTALVSPRLNDPDQRTRQQTFMRALGTIPNLSVHMGSFLSHNVTMKRTDGHGFAEVIKTEEKGSDVNIATHLLVDAFKNDFELAVIVSNDSDLLLPIQIVTNEFQKPVGLLNPQKYPSVALKPHVQFIKQIRHGLLAKCQFPVTLTDARGTFRRPAKW